MKLLKGSIVCHCCRPALFSGSAWSPTGSRDSPRTFHAGVFPHGHRVTAAGARLLHCACAWHQRWKRALCAFCFVFICFCLLTPSHRSCLSVCVARVFLQLRYRSRLHPQSTRTRFLRCLLAGNSRSSWMPTFRVKSFQLTFLLEYFHNDTSELCAAMSSQWIL